MENKKNGGHVLVISFTVFIALLFSGCASPTILKGNIPFKSEPISRIYVKTDWVNNSGKKLNARAQATLAHTLSRAELCNADPGLGSMFGGSVIAAGKKTGSFDFGSGTATWIEKRFHLPANCCKKTTPERDEQCTTSTLYASDGQPIYPYELCDRKNQVDKETLVLQPKLSRLDENGVTVAMDVYLGSNKDLLGTVECSAEAKTPKECIDAPVPDAQIYQIGNEWNAEGCFGRCRDYTMSRCIVRAVEKILADFALKK